MSGRVKLQYRTDGGWLHDLHPLTKLGWLLGLTVGSFLVATPWYPALAVVGLWGAAYLARIRPARDMRGWRLLLSTSAAFFALQVLFTRSGSAVADPSSVLGLVITDEGLRRGVLVAGRFLAVIMASQLFVLTTDPSGLAYALMQAGLPYRYGFALVTAIRLAPLFELEANTIYQAQLARGVRYDGSLFRRIIEVLRQLLLPLLVGALRRAERLAVSMEGRQFGRYRQRTFYRTAQLGPPDHVALAALLGLVVVTIWLMVA